MILSAGLTPAWQQVLLFDRFRPGDVNRATEVHWCAQGKVVNAGIALHHLGGSSLVLAPLGGSAREPIDRELEELNVPRRWIPTETPTRVCTTILDDDTGMMTELVENGRPLLDDELHAFRRAYKEEISRADMAVVTGSLPTETACSFYRDLLERTSCPVVLDFRGDGLLGVLDLEPLVVKPNRDELAQTVGCDLTGDDELLAAMRSLNHQGARWVVVTQGAKPVWVVSSREAYQLHPPRLTQIVNPIGCGDAMAAGIAHALCSGKPVIEAVRYGVAAAADNVGQLLTCRLDPKRIATFLTLVQAERLC